RHHAPQRPTPKTTATRTSAHHSPPTTHHTPHRPPTAMSATNTQHDGDNTDRPHRHISTHNPT
ncbi:hypothetical protein DXG01_007761, partial [Tephrocybe rancida]